MTISGEYFIVKHMSIREFSIRHIYRFISLAAFSILLSSALSANAAKSVPLSVIDDSGVRVVLKHAPKRLISLTPGITEMLFSLGLGQKVVGDTTYCNYPAQAVSITKVGNLTTNYEKVINLKPDLVIVDNVANRDATERLRSLHVPLFVIHPVNIADVEMDLRKIGTITGTRKQAESVIKEMERKIQLAAKLNRNPNVKKKVIAVIGVNPLYVAGNGTFIDDVITRAGAINAAEKVHDYASFSKEVLFTMQPDAVLANPTEANGLLMDRQLRSLPVIKNRRIIGMGGDIMMRPGPRLADGVLILAKSLYK